MCDPLRLLILGAHPDDCEFHAGGLSTIYRQHRHDVRVISVTDGSAGHHEKTGPQLAEVRRAEAAAAAAVIGASSDVWEFPDGRLEPTLAVRERIIREMRTFRPDLVLTHRLNDYHPDHRAVGQAVQDASYMVTVPAIVPNTPILQRDPVIAYLPDTFTRPNPLRADVVVDITRYMETITRMLACHVSQVFEWLPCNEGILHTVPPAEQTSQRFAWLRSWFERQCAPRTEFFCDAIVRKHSEDWRDIRFVEVFEISEYASPLDDAARERLFGFVN